MSNTLYKDTQRVVVDPGSPGTPPRVVETRVYTCGYYPLDLFETAAERAYAVPGSTLDFNGVPRNIGDFLQLTSFVPAAIVQQFIDDGVDILSVLYYICAEVVAYTTSEGTAPTPPVYEQRSTQAWDAKAQSIGLLNGPGYVEFQLSPAGMCNVGLEFEHALPGYPGRYLEPSLYVSVFQEGTRTSARISTSDLGFAAHAATDVYRLERTTNHYVTVTRNGVFMGSVDAGGGAGAGGSRQFTAMRVLAQLYSPTAFVDNPVIVQASMGYAQLPSLAAIGGEGTQPAGSNVMLPQLVTSSRQDGRGALVLPMLRSIGSGREDNGLGEPPVGYAQGVGELPVFTSYAYAGLPTYEAGEVILPPLFVSATGLTGEIGGSEITLPSLLSLAADRDYGDGRIRLPALSALGSAYEGPNTARILNFCTTSSALDGVMLAGVVMNSSGTVATVFTVGLLLDAEALSDGEVSSTMLTEQVLDAVMQTILSATTAVPISEDNLVWVVNLETGATTTYKQYPYNSFAYWQGTYLGARDDGVYRLQGDDDAGEPITALVSLGKHDFGASNFKRPESVYLGVASSGTMYLKIVLDDETEYLYAARNSAETMKTQRVDPGRGIRANYLTFELYNSDGCDFELERVEFRIVRAERRI